MTSRSVRLGAVFVCVLVYGVCNAGVWQGTITHFVPQPITAGPPPETDGTLTIRAHFTHHGTILSGRFHCSGPGCPLPHGPIILDCSVGPGLQLSGGFFGAYAGTPHAVLCGASGFCYGFAQFQDMSWNCDNSDAFGTFDLQRVK